MNFTKILVALSALTIVSVASAATGAVATTTKAPAGSGAALTLSGAPRLVSKTGNSVTVEWDKVTGATAYIVKYGKQSVATAADAYSDESEQVTATGFTLANLTANTQYYLAVVVVDQNGMESDEYSDELAVKTDLAGATATGATAVTTAAATGTTATGAADESRFRVTGANALNTLSFALTFSKEIGADPITVKITRKNDQADVAIASVVKDSANPLNAVVTLASPLDPVTAYSVVVQSVKDAAGASITNGVDAMVDLTTPDTLSPAVAASGSTGTGTDLTKTAALPATGTKENIIVAIALLLGAGVYAYRRRAV